MSESRQSRWQKARKERGICTQCGERPVSATSAWRCEPCRIRFNEWQNRYRGGS